MPEPNPRLGFDPFTTLPWGGWIGRLRTRQIAWIFPLMFVGLLIPSLVEGTLGAPRPLADLRLALGGEGVESPPSFPLLRDTPTMWFAMTIGLTCMLVHLQWKLIARCVTELEQNGVISSRDVPPRKSLVRLTSRVLGARQPGDDALNTLLRQMNRYLSIAMRPAILLLIAAMSALLVIVGEQNELFAVIAPDDLGPREREVWLQTTYQNWWAGTSHSLGLIAYFAMATLGIWVILAQNVVGFACSYFVLSLPQVTHVGADWINRDGKFGWLIVARIFRTVYVSLILHAAGLTVLLVALGPTHIEPVVPLLVLWFFVAPLYILGSWLVFRRVEKRARDARIAELLATPATAESADSSASLLAWEVQRAHDARIRPLRLRSWRVPTAVAVIILPIALAVAQQAMSR